MCLAIRFSPATYDYALLRNALPRNDFFLPPAASGKKKGKLWELWGQKVEILCLM
jgi:hypothetical protein